MEWLYLLVALAIVFILRQRRPAPMSDADLVLVTDFVNTTGEPVFDGSLKQALTVKLAESPYFNVALDSVTRQTLKLMERSPDERVVPPLAREVCQREGAKVAVGGSITSLGSNYILDLDAINCVTGASVAHQEIEAPSKDQVLTKLGEPIPSLRRKLGESLGFDSEVQHSDRTGNNQVSCGAQGIHRRRLEAVSRRRCGKHSPVQDGDRTRS